jgi:Zn-dependent protease
MPIMIYVMSGGRFIFGGAKPVPVNPYLARNPRKFMAITSIAGPITNIAIAAVCAMFTRLVMALGVGGGPSTLLFYGFLKAGFWNVLLASFNLLPIPPLDGSRVLAYLLPWQLAKAFDKVERFGLLIVVVLVFMPPFREVTMPAMWKLMTTIAWLVGLPIEFLME